MDAVDRSELELLRVATSSKLDRLADKVDGLQRELARFVDDHEKRMRSLERWKFAIPMSGLMVIAAFLGGKSL